MCVYEGNAAVSKEPVQKGRHLLPAKAFVAANSSCFQQRFADLPVFDVEPPQLVQGEGSEVFTKLWLVRNDLSQGSPQPRRRISRPKNALPC